MLWGIIAIIIIIVTVKNYTRNAIPKIRKDGAK